jgi:hypothetical protein
MHFATALLSKTPNTSDDTAIVTRVLCLYNGTFTAMGGQSFDLTRDRLKQIFTASQKHLKSGVQVAVFAGTQDHGYSQDAKVGLIEGPYELKQITANDLPDPNLTDLIGKTGLFTTVRITKPEAIAAYKAKLLKPVSVGIDLAGKVYSKFKDAIYELSGVSFSAVPGAALFSVGNMHNQDALAQFASLNFNDELTRKRGFDQLWQLQDAFASVLREVLEEEDEKLDQPREVLLRQLITDYAQALSDRLLSVPSILSSAVPIQFSADPNSDPIEDDMTEEDKAQFAALQAQVQKFEQRDQVATLYARVNTKATALFAARKITPRQLADIQAGAGTTDEAIAKFSGTQDQSEAISALEKLHNHLEGVEQFASPIVQFGSIVGGEPLPGAPNGKPPEVIEREAEELATFATGLTRTVY